MASVQDIANRLATDSAAARAEGQRTKAALTALLSLAGTKADDAAVVKLTGDQAVSGTKTFSTAPVVPDDAFPQAKVTNLTTDLAAKAADTAVVKLTGDQTVAGVKTFSSGPVVPDGSIAQAKVTNLTTDLAGKTAPTTWTPTFEGDTWVPNGVDLTETIQDVVGALVVAGTGVTVAYNDAAGTLTISATGGAGATDPEIVRDTIGAALAGAGLISVAVNDAADTITISTTATANSTDAQLRDRSTHTGTQTASTISDLTESVQDIVGAQLIAGPNTTVNYDDAAGTLTISSSAGSGSLETGKVYFDDPAFAGASDAITLQNALTYAAAQTRVPWVILPARVLTLGTATFNMFTGMKLAGAGTPLGAKGEEISSGKSVITKLRTNAGSGTSALFKASTAIYYVSFAGFTVHGDAGTQVFRSTSNVYGGEWSNLNFYGCGSAFGYGSTEKFLMTQGAFTGFWSNLAPNNVQFNLGGSDNALWTSGYLNIGGNPSVGGAGKYLLQFGGLSKTNVGQVYATANNGWRPLKISEASTFALVINGGWYEGQNDADPCYGNLIRVEGGLVSIRDVELAYGMSSPAGTEHGNVEVTGGNVLLDRLMYRRKTAVAETVPLVYVSGGKADVRSAGADTVYNTWVGLPRVQNAGGTLVNDASVTVI